MKVIHYEVAKNAKLLGIKYKFKTVGILTEADFKALVGVASLFKVEKNGYSGLIKAANEKEFLALVEKVNMVRLRSDHKLYRSKRSKGAPDSYPW